MSQRYNSELPLGDYGAVEAGLRHRPNTDATSQKPEDAPLSEEEAAERRGRVSWKDVPPLLTPFLLFTTIFIPIALFANQTLGYLAAATCFAISGAFFFFSRGLPWRVLAITCFLTTLAGFGMAMYDEAKYLYPYYFYTRSPSYTNIDPTSNPGSVADAGFVEFNSSTFVDSSRSIGYILGSRWCAAPIMVNEMSTYAGYWAVGQDCCGRKSSFQCGDSSNSSVRSGAVIQVESQAPLFQTQATEYRDAVRMASATFGVSAPENVLFVIWGETLESMENSYWKSALTFAAISLVLAFLVGPAFLGLLKATGYSLFGRVADSEWHPEKHELMSFGFNWTPRMYPSYVQDDLMYGRAFWSGEVIQDYVFHVANRHVFYSIIFCHPVHPYQRWQRLVVCLTICSVIVSSTAALTTLIGSSSMVRVAYITITFSVLRIALKYILMSQAIEKSARELDHAQVIGGKNKRSVSQKEVGIVMGFVIFAMLVILASISIINAAQADLGSALRGSLDVICFIYVLDFLTDLLTPFLGHDAFHGNWTVGFFGRWCHERDDFESGKKDMMDRGGTWTSLGAEVFGLQQGSQPTRPPQAGNSSYLVKSGTMQATTERAPLFSQYAVKRN